MLCKVIRILEYLVYQRPLRVLFFKKIVTFKQPLMSHCLIEYGVLKGIVIHMTLN